MMNHRSSSTTRRQKPDPSVEETKDAEAEKMSDSHNPNFIRFIDVRLVVHLEYLPLGQTANQHIYKKRSCDSSFVQYARRDRTDDMTTRGCFTSARTKHLAVPGRDHRCGGGDGGTFQLTRPGYV